MTPKYLRMIRGIKSRGRREWSVYVLRCGDGSLYTGITKDVTARLKKHACGKGAAYTRTHLPVELVYQESKFTRSAALVREAAVKRLPRLRKQQLIFPAPSPVSFPAVTGGESISGSPAKGRRG
jgi:putative endonuclease